MPLCILVCRPGHRFRGLQPTSTDQSIDRRILGDLFNFRQILVHQFGNLFEGLGRGLVPFVLAAPFAADPVKIHGTVRQFHSIQRGRGHFQLPMARCWSKSRGRANQESSSQSNSLHDGCNRGDDANALDEERERPSIVWPKQ
jgi:hypothetical protein